MGGNAFRGFVCVPLAPHITRFLEDFMAEARELFPWFRFVPGQNLHITIEFLGDGIPREKVPQILESIERSAQDTAPFDLCLGEASAFPATGRPRVLYVGTSHGTDKLVRLASDVRAGLRTLGFEEDKPFLPHITLARKKREGHPGVGRDERALWAEAYSRRRTEGLCWTISEVLLMESTLSSGGASYSPLGRVFLKGGV